MENSWNKGKRKRITLSCQFCGKNFEIFPSQSNRKFCGVECQHNSLRGVKRPDYIGKKISAGLIGKRLSENHKKSLKISHLGLVSGMKGKHHSQESKAKIGLSNRGKTAGNKNVRWKGGITHQDRLQRVKFQQTIQKQVLKRDGYTCQMCGIRGGRLQVDHIQPWAEYVELRFDINNCRTLCMGCHYKITFGREKPKDVVWGHNLSRMSRVAYK